MIEMCSLLVALLFSQASPANTQSRISGRVTLHGGGTAVSDARIMLLPAGRPTGPMGGPPPQTTTDENGRYVFQRVSPGTYRINVQKTGLVLLDQSSGEHTVEIAAGQSIDGLDLQVQKGAVITGRILGQTGEPLPDTPVMAMRRMSPARAPSRLVPAPTQGQQTNDLGEFRIAGLPSGEYYVAAMPRSSGMFGGRGVDPSAVPETRTARPTNVTTFYPGTADQAAALPLAVAAGAEVANINFTMQTAPGFRLSGMVVDETGKPVAGAMVMLTADPRNGGMFMGFRGGTRTRDNGGFDIDDVPAGSYQATATVPMTMTSPGRGSGAAVEWSTTNGGSFVRSTYRGGGDGIATDAPTEVVVTDADVTGLRVTIRRPVPR